MRVPPARGWLRLGGQGPASPRPAPLRVACLSFGFFDADLPDSRCRRCRQSVELANTSLLTARRLRPAGQPSAEPKIFGSGKNVGHRRMRRPLFPNSRCYKSCCEGLLSGAELAWCFGYNERSRKIIISVYNFISGKTKRSHCVAPCTYIDSNNGSVGCGFDWRYTLD